MGYEPRPEHAAGVTRIWRCNYGAGGIRKGHWRYTERGLAGLLDERRGGAPGTDGPSLGLPGFRAVRMPPGFAL